MTLAHFGIAIFLVGALLVEGMGLQRETAVRPGGQIAIGDYCFEFRGVQRLAGPNYTADRGTVDVLRDCSDKVATLHPEKRNYASGGQVMTEAALLPGLSRDLYVALGEPLGDGAWAVRVHVKPFVRWIWCGALLMALGGLVTATDRRFRRTSLATNSDTITPVPTELHLGLASRQESHDGSRPAPG
jgi:cytochrome c-type biogenesis protein CcmF